MGDSLNGVEVSLSRDDKSYEKLFPTPKGSYLVPMQAGDRLTIKCPEMVAPDENVLSSSHAAETGEVEEGCIEEHFDGDEGGEIAGASGGDRTLEVAGKEKQALARTHARQFVLWSLTAFVVLSWVGVILYRTKP